MLNKIILAGVFVSSALFGAAQSVLSNMNIYELAYYAVHEKNRSMQRDAVHAIRRAKVNDGRCMLNVADFKNMKPFDCAIQALNKVPAELDPYMRQYQKCILKELIPECETERDEYGCKIKSLLLNSDPELRKSGEEAFYSASPDQRAVIRERFRYHTGGHFVEAHLDEAEGINGILNKHVLQKVNEVGTEKAYAINFLQYLLSSISKVDAISLHQLDILLYEVVKSETTLPSFVPCLLAKDAFPHACFNTGGQDSSPFGAVLSRLAQEPQSEVVNSHLHNLALSTFIEPALGDMLHVLQEGFSVWKNLPLMDGVRLRTRVSERAVTDEDLLKTISYLRDVKFGNEKIKDTLGEIGKHFTLEDYKRHWPMWLKVCMLLGADVKVLRQSVFPFLKKEFETQDDLETVKMIRNGELDDFHKFALACVIQEFLAYFSESLKESRESAVYDFTRYFWYGEIVLCTDAEERTLHMKYAEYYYNRLSPETQAIILSL